MITFTLKHKTQKTVEREFFNEMISHRATNFRAFETGKIRVDMRVPKNKFDAVARLYDGIRRGVANGSGRESCSVVICAKAYDDSEEVKVEISESGVSLRNDFNSRLYAGVF